MSEVQTDPQKYEDEIDLRELFQVLWENKYRILAGTLLVALLTGLVSIFLLTPVYQTKLDLVISMPEQYHTRYGDYKLPISTNDQYISLLTNHTVLANTIRDMKYDPEKVRPEKLKKQIEIDNKDAAGSGKKNIFHITVSADSPQKSLKLARTLYANYIEFVDILTKEEAVTYYTNYFNTELQSLDLSLKDNQALLKENEKLLNGTSQTISQNDLMEAIQEGRKGSQDYIVVENIINDSYTKIQNDVVSNRQTIYSIENSIRSDQEKLKEIKKEKEKISKYHETDGKTPVESDFIRAVETGIHMPSEPVAPTQKTGPSNGRNVLIGMVTGFLLSAMAVFIRKFWMEKPLTGEIGKAGAGETEKAEDGNSVCRNS